LSKCKSWTLRCDQSIAERDLWVTVKQRRRRLHLKFTGEQLVGIWLWGPRLSNETTRHTSPWPWRLRRSASVAAATSLTTSIHPIPCHPLGHPHQARGSSLLVDCDLVVQFGDRQDTRSTFSTRRLNIWNETIKRINPLTRRTTATTVLRKIVNRRIQRPKKMSGSRGVWAS
jgi:hypothetical protein